MKTLKYVGMVALMMAGVFGGCKKSFLERNPYGALTEEIIANKAGVNYLLIGAYAALDGQQNGRALGGAGDPWTAAPTNWIYGSVVGGESHKGSNAGDQEPINAIAAGTSNSTNAFFNSKWKAVFEGVSRCNLTLIKMKEATDMSPEERVQVEAEVRFLRGHYYFELKRFFNKVPYITDTTTDVRVANDKDIWPYIEADFKYAMEKLPPKQAEVARANKWAAQVYLAKTYLYQKKYQEAYTLFDDAIKNGRTSNDLPYGLTPRFEDNFDAAKKNNQESVFAIQMTANDGTNTIANANAGDMLNFPYDKSPFNCCGFFQPSQDLVNSYRVNELGLPYLDDYNKHGVKSDMGLSSGAAFVADADPLDPRLDWTVGRRNIPYHDWGYHPGADWLRDQSYGGPYSPKKMVYWKVDQDKYKDAHSWAPGSAINVLLIRFSDVLLMTAECAAQLNDLGTAMTLVNRVRSRMKDNPANWLHDYKPGTTEFNPNKLAANYKIELYTSFPDKGYALKAIYFERKLELANEGHRFFDLSRWGIADQVMNAYYAFESKITPDLNGANFTKGRNEYFPVPQRQIDLTLKDGKPVLTQNAGY
ncbi:RagB/SusD family nutrient uptake outer membrane protein [Chitinophaga nivalis]|uniref:RagB/SusD family nutrient uptake outer membrane protein n=1 Tax=Chitinophaga nivalis TaxID=2991709 RepID=A0ABT3ITD8_9BACT|nr:RagB/SusD family nutrient uptake outer membrane protein [Chitinophaga nivalis]MCW3463072.1 RagB/SusD family nutrient uptake outer membrane protein [Chitinophaga nivalis]MCW3487238.1 RagB/SusD family nutrient uptake outer membrane protein [Chitinophaga nivalis]